MVECENEFEVVPNKKFKFRGYGEDESDRIQERGPGVSIKRGKERARNSSENPRGSSPSLCTSKNVIDRGFEEGFYNLGLSYPLVRALTQIGIMNPTPIQREVIPTALSGKDVFANAPTGSGKTLAFVIPCVQRLIHQKYAYPVIRVLVLVPTRELAQQCKGVIESACQFTDIKSVIMVGGTSVPRKGSFLDETPDIVVATPGRLIDCLKGKVLSLDAIEMVVLDEADRMLEIGFRSKIEEILNKCPEDKQTILLSVTEDDKVDNVAERFLKNAIRCCVKQSSFEPCNIKQEFIRITDATECYREAYVLSLATDYYKEDCIIFFPTKDLAKRMNIIFRLHHLDSVEIHGDLDQSQRDASILSFRKGKAKFLLCSDVAARGIDIPRVKTVINYSMPTTYKQYVHRIGRTARAGKSGISVSLVSERDKEILQKTIAQPHNKTTKRKINSELVTKHYESIRNLQREISLALEIGREEKLIMATKRKLNELK